MTTLADDFDAPMDLIAETAEIRPATLYRYFPTRQELIEAMVSSALVEGREIVARAGELPADHAAVRALATEAVRHGERYSFLIGTSELSARGADPVGLSSLMKVWQANGVLRADVAPLWLATAFIVLAQALFAPTVTLRGGSREEALAELFMRSASHPESPGGVHVH